MAVVDCSLVNADRIAEIAGGHDSVQLIEVPYSFQQIESFADQLTDQLGNTGMPFGVAIDSTPTGRWIVVRVEEPEDLPSDFGSGVPVDAFSIEQGEIGGEAG